MLTLRTFGECRIDVARPDGAPFVLAPNADRLFSLALLLAGEAGRPVPRARVAAWLWPELDAPRARQCLRQALYRLRAAGVPIEATADHLCLPRDAVAPTFAAAPTAARLAPASPDGIAPRLGRCLPGWTPAADAFAEWVDAYRARQEAAARAALGAALAAAPDAHAAVPIAHALLDLDPANIVAARALAADGRDDGRLVGDAPTLPLVGRGALVAVLTERLRAACAGRGGGLRIEGPTGVGTSRLLDELAAVARRRAVAVVAARGPDGHGDPLAACRTLVAALLERPGALGAAPETLAALRRFAGGVGAPAPGSAAERLLGTRLAELAGAVAAEHPLLLVADDRAPGARRCGAVLAHAAAALGDAAVLAVWTTPVGTDPPAAGVERLDVPPLDPADATALARSAAAAVRATLSDADAAWCAATAAGRPGDVIALARHRAATPGARSAPPAIAARHAATLAALPPAQRRALQAAVVLGPHATRTRTAATVRAVGGSRDGGRAVAALVGAGVLRTTTAGRLRPSHPFTAHAVAAALAAGERRALHAAAGTTLEHEARAALAGGDPGAAAVARAAAAHWRAAGDTRPATALLAHVGAALLAAGRTSEAVALLSRALDAARGARRPGARTVADLEALVAGALFAAGDARAAVAVSRAPASDRAELVALQSAWRAGRPWAPLLARARRLAADVCAGTAERLEAVALAAALADNAAPAASGDPLGEPGAVLDTLVDRPDAPPPLALRATMIHHVGAGDLATGVDAARALARLLLARPLGVDGLGPLLATADAIRAGGDAAAAAGLYAQVHAAAARRRLAGYAARAALRAGALACEGGDAPAAGRWAREGERWVARAADDRLAWEVADLGARVLLARGDAPGADAAARATLARVRRARSATPRLWRAVLTTAAETRLAVGGWRRGAPPPVRRADGRLLAALLAVHRRLAGRTGHDRTVAACAAALVRVGAASRAAALVEAYVAGPRRALVAPPPALAAFAARAAPFAPADPPPCPPAPSASSPSPSSAPAMPSSSPEGATR